MADPAHASEIPVSVVLNPANPDAVHGLVKEVAQLSAGFSSENQANRLEMLEKLRALQLALETPGDTLIRHLWADVSLCLGIPSEGGTTCSIQIKLNKPGLERKVALTFSSAYMVHQHCPVC
jgi:ribonuclease I